MKNLHFLKIGLLWVVVAVATGCFHQGKIPAFDPAFEPYIESFTSGTVASDAVISIQFTFPVDTPLIKTLQASDLITSSPRLKGDLTWPNAYTLVFKPEKYLKEGKVYLFELHLDRLINVPKEMRTFRFGIQVMEQGFQLSQWMIHAFDSQGITKYYVTGEVKSANPANAADLDERLKLKVADRVMPLHWRVGESEKLFTFSSDTFGRNVSPSKIELQGKGDNIYIPKEQGREVLLGGAEPGPVQWRMFFGDPNYLWLAFSEPLDPRQNLNGLVLLDGMSPHRFLIRENQL